MLVATSSLVVLCVLSACGDDALPALPVADAGFDVRTTVGSPITLDGTASRGPDGASLSYSWRHLAHPEGSTAELGGPMTVQPTFQADAPGQYLFELVVSTGSGSSAPDTVAVLATASAPVAIAACEKSDCRVLHGRTAGLRGRDSYDPDGDALTHSWEQVTSVVECNSRCPELAPCYPANENAPIADPTAADTTFVAPEGRDLQLVFELAVHDPISSSQACVVYVTTNTPPLIATVSGTPTTVDEGAVFALTATTGDSEQDPITHTWEQVSGDSVGTLAAQEDVSVTAPQVDANTLLEFRLIVSDGIDTTASDDAPPAAPGQLVRVNVRNLN